MGDPVEKADQQEDRAELAAKLEPAAASEAWEAEEVRAAPAGALGMPVAAAVAPEAARAKAAQLVPQARAALAAWAAQLVQRAKAAPAA